MDDVGVEPDALNRDLRRLRRSIGATSERGRPDFSNRKYVPPEDHLGHWGPENLIPICSTAHQKAPNCWGRITLWHFGVVAVGLTSQQEDFPHFAVESPVIVHGGIDIREFGSNRHRCDILQSNQAPYLYHVRRQHAFHSLRTTHGGRLGVNKLDYRYTRPAG